MPTRIQVIELDHVGIEYQFIGTMAIIEHPRHGRVLLVDRFAAPVPWEHGRAVKLKDVDTLRGLRKTRWNQWYTLLSAALAGHDEARPPLAWSRHVIETIAKQAGL